MSASDGLQKDSYRDAVDPYMQIGDTIWEPIDVKVELSEFTSPDYVDFVAIPAPETELPEQPTETEENGGLLGREFVLYVDTEISSERDAGNEETLIFTGQLTNLSTAAEGGWEGLAHDPSHQAFSKENSGSLYNSTVDIPGATSSPAGISPTGDVVGYTATSYTQASGTEISAKDLAEKILDKAPIPTYEIRLSESGYGESPKLGKDTDLFYEENTISVSRALSDIEQRTNSASWFDRTGKFWIGAPEPDEHIFKHELHFITDTSAGLTTPPYQSVRVIGSGVASEEGWGRTNMNADEKVTNEENLSDSEGIELVEPTFEYKNLSLTTQEQVDNVTSDILKKLQKQRADGTVTVVGMPEVRPYDGIVMPDTPDQRMGGYTYSVKKVVHKINNSNGFETTIHVGGLTDLQQGLQSEDISSQETFESGWYKPNDAYTRLR